MLFLALLVPPLLMCALLGLGRYEERVLGPLESAPDPAGQTTRRLYAVPDPTSDAGAPASHASTSGAPAPGESRSRGRHRRHAA
ncbi:hypothetical protein [Streptomyces goshikiensis]|uniref:hypothetical protein n=1 Tax=Streptomyces goshikiensis TaxID=1942 RepID=UPI003662F0F0